MSGPFRCDSAGAYRWEGEAMLDVVYVAIVVAFFAVALWYTNACDRGIGVSS